MQRLKSAIYDRGRGGGIGMEGRWIRKMARAVMWREKDSTKRVLVTEVVQTKEAICLKRNGTPQK